DASEIYELRIMPAAGGKSEFVSGMRSPNSKITWSSDGKRIYYTQIVPSPDPNNRTQPTSALMSVRTDGVDKKTHVKFSTIATAADLKPAVTEFSLTVPRQTAQGKLALRNARIITMKGDEVIEHGDIVIENGRIVAAGPHGRVAIPAGARQIDLAGKTVMPGM